MKTTFDFDSTQYGWLYIITSPTNKIYIGKTRNLVNRKSSYRGLHCKSQHILYKSLSKYGFNKHKFEIIIEGNFTDNELSELEVKYISEYNSYNKKSKNGMNLTLGGEGCSIQYHTEETKKKISKTKKLAPRTEKEIEASKRRIGKKVKKSKEWIDNNAESIKKPIIQYTLEGKFVKEWNGAIDVENELGISRKAISNNLRNITKSSYGYIWKFKGDDDIIPKINKKGYKRKVIDLETGIIYESISEMSKHLNISKNTIVTRLRSKNKKDYKIDYYEN